MVRKDVKEKNHMILKDNVEKLIKGEVDKEDRKMIGGVVLALKMNKNSSKNVNNNNVLTNKQLEIVPLEKKKIRIKVLRITKFLEISKIKTLLKIKFLIIWINRI